MGILEISWIALEAWLWKNSVYIAIVTSTIYHWDKPHGFCTEAMMASQGYCAF